MSQVAQGTKQYQRPRYSIRTIWGMAKSPELLLTEETLYTIIERETKKDSMKKLSQGEIDKVCRILQQMKDDVKRSVPTAPQQKRTDEGGNPQTMAMRKRIYILTGQLGWNDNNNRVNGFVKSIFGVEHLSWLTPGQCHKLIEILKDKVSRL